MKAYKLLILIVLSTLFLQSCERLLTGRSNKNKVHGTVTDKETGEAIKEVKLSIYIDDFDRTNGEDEITEHNAYTDNSGYYDIKFKREDGTHYYIKPTHEDYTLVILNGWYPNLKNGLENEINFEMNKLETAKKNIITYLENFENPYDYSSRVANVKILILKRHEEDNTSYPISIDTVKYTNDNGECIVEYWEEKGYNYFLKPSKDGYYYEYGGYDFKSLSKSIPGYIPDIRIKLNEVK